MLPKNCIGSEKLKACSNQMQSVWVVTHLSTYIKPGLHRSLKDRKHMLANTL